MTRNEFKKGLKTACSCKQKHTGFIYIPVFCWTKQVNSWLVSVFASDRKLDGFIRLIDFCYLFTVSGGISAYNAGVGNVRTYEGMDIGTTGNDYANDVVARAQWFKRNGF